MRSNLPYPCHKAGAMRAPVALAWLACAFGRELADTARAGVLVRRRLGVGPTDAVPAIGLAHTISVEMSGEFEDALLEVDVHHALLEGVSPQHQVVAGARV